MSNGKEKIKKPGQQVVPEKKKKVEKGTSQVSYDVNTPKKSIAFFRKKKKKKKEDGDNYS